MQGLLEEHYSARNGENRSARNRREEKNGG